MHEINCCITSNWSCMDMSKYLRYACDLQSPKSFIMWGGIPQRAAHWMPPMCMEWLENLSPGSPLLLAHSFKWWESWPYVSTVYPCSPWYPKAGQWAPAGDVSMSTSSQNTGVAVGKTLPWTKPSLGFCFSIQNPPWGFSTWNTWLEFPPPLDCINPPPCDIYMDCYFVTIFRMAYLFKNLNFSALKLNLTYYHSKTMEYTLDYQTQKVVPVKKPIQLWVLWAPVNFS